MMITRSFIVKTGSIGILLLLALSVTAQKTAPPKPTLPTIFQKNLIQNGNAESGDGSGWSNAGELKTILYGDFGGGPGKDSPGPTDRGEKYFYARTTTSQPTATFSQKTDVSSAAATVDKGGVSYNFGGWFGVANGSSSSGRLKITFLDAAGKELKTDITAVINEDNRPPDETMVERNGGGELPVGTRKISIVLEFKIFGKLDEERDNLAFADNLWLTLTSKGDK
ncbi:MAG: hypothetical protein QM785_17520 [Pyrinomonadaceae bacterium]